MRAAPSKQTTKCWRERWQTPCLPPPAMTNRHHCEKHSSESGPHPEGDGLRQVSWLALHRLPRLPRHMVQWHSGSLGAYSCGRSHGSNPDRVLRVPFSPAVFTTEAPQAIPADYQEALQGAIGQNRLCAKRLCRFNGLLDIGGAEEACLIGGVAERPHFCTDGHQNLYAIAA